MVLFKGVRVLFLGFSTALEGGQRPAVGSLVVCLSFFYGGTDCLIGFVVGGYGCGGGCIWVTVDVSNM